MTLNNCISCLRLPLLLLGALIASAETSAQNLSKLSPMQQLEIQQVNGLDPTARLEDRVKETPADILKQFQEAGMAPKSHQLTAAEKEIVSSAFALLPPLHRRVLKTRLRSISFLDNMPNTALTGPVNTDTEFRLYHITIRAAILRQTVSEWLTEKEKTCFDTTGSPLRVSINAGSLNALVYVLLHESTHVLDGSLGITPGLIPVNETEMLGQANPLTAKIWEDRTLPAKQYRGTLLDSTRYRRGKILPVTRAVEVYEALSHTPFVSLYSTSSWHEDLAELLTVYQLTQKLNQPFRISVIDKDKKEIYFYEPMKSVLVKNRITQLKLFYF